MLVGFEFGVLSMCKREKERDSGGHVDDREGKRVRLNVASHRIASHRIALVAGGLEGKIPHG